MTKPKSQSAKDFEEGYGAGYEDGCVFGLNQPATSATPALRPPLKFSQRAPAPAFLLPSNTPVLVRVIEQLRTMNVEQVALVETVALAIAKGGVKGGGR